MKHVSIIKHQRLRVGYSRHDGAVKFYFWAQPRRRIFQGGCATYRDSVVHYWIEGK